jgi:hypothetical protein
MDAFEELRSRKAELAAKCKTKAEEISLQTDYIIGNFGKIAIGSLLGDILKKNNPDTKSEILKILVAEGIDTAVNIQKDPHHIKDKLLDALKKSATGVLNLLIK